MPLIKASTKLKLVGSVILIRMVVDVNVMGTFALERILLARVPTSPIIDP
jgi:hypothetical protein